MGFWDVLLARPISLDEAEEALGRPDDREAKELAYHVERCSKRWALSYRASKHNGAQINRMFLFGVILGVALLVKDSPLAHKLLGFL